jgi:hypothetical protein
MELRNLAGFLLLASGCSVPGAGVRLPLFFWSEIIMKRERERRIALAALRLDMTLRASKHACVEKQLPRCGARRGVKAP